MKGLLLTYLMTYGGALAGLIRPIYGVSSYMALFILRPAALWPWAVPRSPYSQVVMVATLVGWLKEGFGSWQFGRGTASIVFLLSYFTWGMVSSQLSADPTVAWGWVNSMSKIVLPVMIGATTIRSLSDLKVACWTIVGAYGYLCLEFNLYYFRGTPLLGPDTTFGGIDEVSMCVGVVTAIGMALFLSLHYQQVWLRGLIAFAALLMIHFVLFSMSRGGMLGVVLIGIVSLPMWPRRPLDIAMLFAVLLVSAILVSGSVIQEFSTTFADSGVRDNSAQSRIDLWKGCIDLMCKNPIFGIGPDHFPLNSENYGYIRRESHTLWLNYGAELGFPGLFFIAAFYGMTILRLIGVLNDPDPDIDPWIRSSAKMVIAGLFGFAISAQFVALDMMETPYYTGMIGVATLAMYSRDKKERESQSALQRIRIEPDLVAVAQ